MKRYAYILIIELLATINGVLAQDLQRFSERDVVGTARYIGMGGAMTAVGGDPSAVMDNPAGLGLYRRSEIQLTIDETMDYTQQVGSNDMYQRLRFGLPQVSAIWSWGKNDRQRGLVYSNFMFSMNRLTNYNREVVVHGAGMGLVNTICEKTNNLSEEYLVNKPWNDTEIGWLSILGYEGYLIDPSINNQWVPAVDFTNGSLSIYETGTVDQYTLSWSGNISNQWYVGINLNIPTLTYRKEFTLHETNRINSAKLKSLYYASGLGVSGTLGVLYRPLQWLRVGASFQTPALINLSVQTEGDMYSMIRDEKYEILTPSSGVVNTQIVLPLRTSIGLAGQIGKEGMISIQYDYAHSEDIEDVHTLRIGAEAQVYRGLFMNAGYVYESSFLNEEPIVTLDYNSIRTDLDYRYTVQSQYASIGLGYRDNIIVGQVTYQYRWQRLHQYATEMQVTPFGVNTHAHRIVASLAWRF